MNDAADRSGQASPLLFQESFLTIDGEDKLDFESDIFHSAPNFIFHIHCSFLNHNASSPKRQLRSPPPPPKRCWLWTPFVTTSPREPQGVAPAFCAWPTLLSFSGGGGWGLGLAAGSPQAPLAPRPPGVPSPGTKPSCADPSLARRRASTWGLPGALQGRSGWQFMVCGISSLPTHDLSRPCFPWKAAPAWNPLPGKRLPLRCSQGSWAGEGERGGGQRPPGSSLSLGNDRCVSSAPGFSLSPS